jgi:hypothetical protein
MNKESMKKGSHQDADDLRPEYHRSDFSTLVRGKYAARLAEASNVVVLEPEIAQAFPNDQAVNDALRGLLEVAATTAHLTRLAKKRRAG